PAHSRILPANRGDGVRGQVRRRRGGGPGRGGHRARRRLAYVENPPVDLPRVPRAQGGERSDREGDPDAEGALRARSREDRRAHDPCRPPCGDSPCPSEKPRRQQPALFRLDRGVRRARGGDRGPAPARLSRDRHLGAFDRGDRAADPADRGGPEGRGRGRRGHVTAKAPVPWWRWAIWWMLLGLSLLVFYVLLTPIWLGLRGLAWLAEFRSRRLRDR